MKVVKELQGLTTIVNNGGHKGEGVLSGFHFSVSLSLSLEAFRRGWRSSLGEFWRSCAGSILRFLLGLFRIEVSNEFLHLYYCRAFRFLLENILCSLVFSPCYQIIFLYL